jgi:hypothetical protein
MSETTVKTTAEAVKSIKSKTANDIPSTEKRLLDDFAMSAMVGLLSSNKTKDIGINSYRIAQEMMVARQQTK